VQISRALRLHTLPRIMDQPSGSNRRLEVLARHLVTASLDDAEAPVQPQQCAGAVRSLPRFDSYLLERYLDELRELKRVVYDIFKNNPELLTPVEEGLTKGTPIPAANSCMPTVKDRRRAVPARGLVRATMRDGAVRTDYPPRVQRRGAPGDGQEAAARTPRSRPEPAQLLR
jgi:hypothetical protein